MLINISFLLRTIHLILSRGLNDQVEAESRRACSMHGIREDCVKISVVKEARKEATRKT